ncbi:MAG: hypothetical protein WCH98_21835 [Verrucomicrobiota bacterium]
MAILWTAVIAASVIFPMILVVRGRKKHGGHDNYVPSLPGLPVGIALLFESCFTDVFP